MAGNSGPRPRVLVVYPLASREAEERLAGSVEVLKGGSEGRDELSALVADVDGVILRPPAVVDAALLSQASRLRVIGNIGTGLDHIDLAETERRGITVVSSRGGNANAVAEYVAGMILAAAHRLFAARDLMSREDFSWAARIAALRGTELRGRVLGIVGLGAIGRRLSEIAANGLGMRVVAYDPFVTAGDVEHVELLDSVREVCESAFVLSVHAPLTPETRGLIGSEEIEALGAGAVLVNSSRGGVVDEQAVVSALRAGRLGAAILDVLDTEPPTRERIVEMAEVPGLIVTPHIAGITTEAGAALCDAAVDGVLEQLAPGD
jgi:phosphoglycerate dehydrogenase-like enzyme